jgi:hypothetical protein
MALTKMRDRVFKIGHVSVRLRSAGTYRRAAKWKLELFAEPQNTRNQPARESACEPLECSVNLKNRGSHSQPTDMKGKCEPCEPCEPFSASSHVRTRAYARDKDGPGIGSQGSQGSQTNVNSEGYTCEPRCEPQKQGSQGPLRPDWLKDLDP